MIWQAALEYVVAQTKVERYRHLCSEANTLAPPNDRDAYRSLMIRQAAQPEGQEPPAQAPDVPHSCCGQILPG